MIDFAEKRLSDPQWVIDRLVEQTTKQGKEINRLNKLIVNLEKENVKLKSVNAEPEEPPFDVSQAQDVPKKVKRGKNVVAK